MELAHLIHAYRPYKSLDSICIWLLQVGWTERKALRVHLESVVFDKSQGFGFAYNMMIVKEKLQ